MQYLDRVNSPVDVKKMNIDELKGLADDVRQAILKRDSIIGGHVGPNLGFVDATIALHYVFNSPVDKIVFDVSHQCYAHKIITGRKNGFLNPDDYSKISGYTAPTESEHDHFIVGHTSTSLSLASGLAKARDLKGEKFNVVAVIGDGSLSGGEALEGLDFAGGELNSNLIVVVNDNQMSIAENHGGLYQNLKLLRETNGQAELNLFKAFGYDYVYVNDGNDINELIKVFSQVKDSSKPVVVHLNTLKGKGYKPAETTKEAWHWSMPFDINSGEKVPFAGGENYHDITFEYLQKKTQEDNKVAVIVAGTPGAMGLTPDRRRALGRSYIDVGIAEEHAVAMSSALAKGGCKPVFMVWSSFVQRTYDQLSQDLAINNNPAVILVFAGALSGADVTHLGCFDIPMISNIPNIVYLAPTTKEEYLAMLEWGIEQTSHPVVIRVPSQVMHGDEVAPQFDELNRSLVLNKGQDVAVFALGSFLGLGESVIQCLKAQGINATLVNPRFITGVDEALLNELKANHKVVVTLEDGIVNGGFGEKIARFYGDGEMKVLVYGGKKEFTDRVSLADIYKANNIEAEVIAKQAKALL